MQVQEIAQFGIGVGTIDPAARIESGEITDAEINDFAVRSQTNEFDQTVDESAIPCMCVDGRCGGCEAGPNAAGGTFSIVIGDALSEGADVTTSMLAGDTAATHAKRIYSNLVAKGYRIGGHSDEFATSENSGCGAQDKLDVILAFIGTKGDDVRAAAATLGVEVTQESHDRIVKNSVMLLDQNYVSGGRELMDAYKETATENSVDILKDKHKEVLLRVNMRPGTTFDRRKVPVDYRDRIQAFNLDVPGLANGTEAISVNQTEADAKLVGALYYNIATAAVLAGPTLRVVVAK